MSRLFHSQRHAACSVDYPQAARRHVLAASLVLAVAASSFASPRADAQPALSAAETAVHAINLPAAPLGQSLNNLAQQAGVQIIFAGQLTEGKNAPALHGSYTAADALQRLLAGSGLTALARDAKTFTVTNTSDAGADGGVLAPVMVTAERPDDLPAAYAGGQVARGGRLGMLGNKNVMDTPFNITNYTSQLIEDQQAATVLDVLKNDPSVRQSSAPGGSYAYFDIRGFTVDTSEVTFDGLSGMVPRYGGLSAEFAERVELLKGSSALLNGMSPNGTVGGAVNLVPKRADDKPLTRLTLGVESDALWKGHVDVGRRFGANGEWGLRVNGSYGDGDGFIDDQKRSAYLGALALDYRGERLRLTLDAFRVQEERHGGAAMTILRPSSVLAPPDSRTNVMPGYSHKNAAEAVILGGEYDFNDRWTGYAKLGTQQYESPGFMGTSVQNLQANGDATLHPAAASYDGKTTSAETGLRGHFQTGAVSHALALSASYLNRDNSSVSAPSAAQPTNIYNPGPIMWPTVPTDTSKTSESTLSGIALADTLGFMDDRVLLTLGVRRQNVKATNFSASTGAVTSRYDASAWSPMAGLVVKPTDDLSLYANYIQGLSQGTIVGDIYQNAGHVFPPYKTEQMEAGAKLQTGNFTNTISVFQMARPSTTIDYSTSPLPTLRLDGEQRNRGIEWTIFGELTRDLRVLGGVTYMQAKLSKTQDGLQDGNQAPGSPRWVTNLGADWDVSGLPGLALNGRVIHTSRQYIDNANSLQLPSWAILNLGGRYTTRLGGKNVVFRANVDNVFDRNYWQGTFKLGGGGVIIGAPRTFRLSATIDF